MSRLKLFLLGSPHVERDGMRVEAERRTVIALLAYLAVMEQAHSRDTLATLFWPDTDQAHARGALRRDISVLNKMLGGGRLAVEGQTVALQRSPGLWVDVTQFHSLLALCQTHGHPEVEVCPACLAPLTEAVTLYQDDFLAGFTLRQSPNFDDWQFFQTESLHRELASALERLVRGHSAQGEFEPAIGYARRWLALDPLHEPAHRALMQLYAWSGQRNAALRQYGECMRILERELGVSPEMPTAQLYEAIKDNQAPQAADLHLTSRPEKSARQDNLLYAPGRSVIGPAMGYRSVASRDEPEPALLELPFSPLDRVGRSRLVGRERELAEANALWQQAASTSGEGRVLFVSGEPGIGKTRLVRELANSVEASGAKVLISECYAEGGPPYAPIAQMLRAILGETGEASFDLGLPSFVLADLITLAPDLRLHYPDVPPNPSLEAQAEQQRLFESVVAWYNALTQAVRVPLMLLVEDVHWADSSTLFLLRHLVRRSRTRQTKLRLLLVMTYREAELNAVPALNEVLLDLNRERLAEQLKLSRLNREQAHDLLASMLTTGGEISSEFLDGIYRETEGNPFFIEEVCKALIEEGKLYYFGGSWRRMDMAAIHLPQSVRGAILSRVEKLPAPVQETLRLAAVLGREFDFDTLQGASDLNEEALIVALERAERTQLIGEVQRAGQVTFAFTHALIPFTLRESISGLRLQRLHRRVATAIEAQRPNSYEALAYHFAAAGEREQAVRYSRHAAQRAAAMYAYDMAAQHLQTALDLIEAGEQIELRMTLLEQLADATYLLGEHTRAIPPYQEALDLWRSPAGVDKMIAVRLHRKIIQRVTNLPRVADFQAFETMLQASLTEGLQLIEGAPPHVEIVRLLTALAPEPLMWRVRSSMDWTAAERYARAAVDMAEHLDVPAELAAALVALAAVYAARGLLRERVPIARHILTLCRDPRFTDIRERMGALYEASIALVDAGEYKQALPYFQEAERLADQMRAVNEQVFALARQAQCWLRLDRWDEVLSTEEKLQAVKQRYPEFAERARTWCFYAALKAGVHALRGEFELAATWREEATAIMVAINGPPEQWTRSQHY